jgi:hypothetical protein
MAGLGASTQRLVDDGLDGTRASTTFDTATVAVKDLLGTAREVFRGADGTADIVVVEDIAGTNDHESGRSIGDAEPSILKTAAGCKRKNLLFKRFQTDPRCMLE